MKQAIVGVALLGLAATAHAQSGALPVPELVARSQAASQVALASPTLTQRSIHVSHVPPEQIVAWLGAEHKALPLMERLSRRNWLASGQSETEYQPLASPVPARLPDGVEFIKVEKAQNTLRAFGRPEALDSLAELVLALDKPLRQIEVSSWLIEVAPDELARLGVDFAPAGKTDKGAPFTLAKWHGDPQKWIAAREAQGTAKLVTAPRVVTLHGMTASMAITQSQPATIETAGTTEKIEFDARRAGEKALAQPRLGIRRDFTVTPKANADGSFTLRFRLAKMLELTLHDCPKDAALRSDDDRPDDLLWATHPLQVLDGLTATFACTAGESVVITGFPQEIFRGNTESSSATLSSATLPQGRQMALFVTARPKHSDEPIPGT